MNDLTSGLGLMLFSAICGGAFAVPLKKRRCYEWENTWLLGFTFALIIIPMITVSLVLPVWTSAFARAGTRNVVTAMTFGFLWGWGAVTFAVGVNSLGLSLGYAIIMGINTAVGSTVPMIRRWGEISGSAKLVIVVGIAICTIGVVICGKAGALREKDSSLESGTAAELSSPKTIGTTIFLAG